MFWAYLAITEICVDDVFGTQRRDDDRLLICAISMALSTTECDAYGFGRGLVIGRSSNLFQFVQCFDF